MIENSIQISSSSNARFKFLQSLEKSKTRRQLSLTSVEGVKEIEMAIEANVQFHSLYFVQGMVDQKLLNKVLALNSSLDIFELSSDLFSKTAYRESTGGLVAIIHTKERQLSSFYPKGQALVLVVDGVEKPGNLGAILRTADAAAIDAVICSDLPGDLYNPNTVRASLGTVFTVPVYTGKGEEVRLWLSNNGFKTYCTNLHLAHDYDKEDYTGSCAIVVGTEATGVTQEWIDFADQNVKIPMLGKIDSMNVSVASAVMLFEAKRQRK